MRLHVPPMQFKTGMESQFNEGLGHNQDPYGHACYRFASEWATRMEAGLQAAGVDATDDAQVAGWLAANAERCGRDADDEGITGFMYGCAVNILAHCWRHGEQLRRWHNIDTQIGNEGERANESGGVLNPAVLNIGA